MRLKKGLSLLEIEQTTIYAYSLSFNMAAKRMYLTMFVKILVMVREDGTSSKL